MTYHSQFGEDRWLAEHCQLPEHGVFVDVGAGDPIELSNTYWLERRGWDGVCIDADPRCLDLLRDRRKRVVAAAVSEHEREATFQIAPEMHYSGLSVVNGNGSVTLVTERLDKILQREGIERIDVLSVDTEGTEIDVLLSLGDYRPTYIIVEHVTGGRDHRDELLGHLEPSYYLLHETACNLILCRRDDLEQQAIEGIPAIEQVAKYVAGYQRTISQSVLAVESIPRYGTNAHADCLLSLIMDLGVTVDRQQGVYWDQCLTRTMEAAVSRGYQYVLTLDHDTIFHSEDVRELWRIMKENPKIDALCGCQVARERNQPLMMHVDAATGNYWVPVTEDEIHSEIVRLKTAHFGLTMFRCASLRRMKKPWFLAVPDAGGAWGEGHLDADIAFWANWWECGNTLYQANHVVLGHAQEIISWPGEDLKPVHQYMGTYRTEGRPKESLNYKEPIER